MKFGSYDEDQRREEEKRRSSGHMPYGRIENREPAGPKFDVENLNSVRAAVDRLRPPGVEIETRLPELDDKKRLWECERLIDAGGSKDWTMHELVAAKSVLSEATTHERLGSNRGNFRRERAEYMATYHPETLASSREATQRPVDAAERQKVGDGTMRKPVDTLDHKPDFRPSFARGSGGMGMNGKTSAEQSNEGMRRAAPAQTQPAQQQSREERSDRRQAVPPSLKDKIAQSKGDCEARKEATAERRQEEKKELSR